MKRLTVGQLINELEKYDKDKLVFIDDEHTGGYTTLEAAYSIASKFKPEYDRHIYLAPTDN